jgi:hypothetical protein
MIGSLQQFKNGSPSMKTRLDAGHLTPSRSNHLTILAPTPTDALLQKHGERWELPYLVVSVELSPGGVVGTLCPSGMCNSAPKKEAFGAESCTEQRAVLVY